MTGKRMFRIQPGADGVKNIEKASTNTKNAIAVTAPLIRIKTSGMLPITEKMNEASTTRNAQVSAKSAGAEKALRIPPPLKKMLSNVAHM